MQPNEGPLQTGQHILARIIQNIDSDARVIMARFDKPEEASFDIISGLDLRKIKLEKLEREVNAIIQRRIPVKKSIISRKEAESEFDLRRLPDTAEIRIVDVVGIDRRPCKDPHVDNTEDIGYLKINYVKKKGKDKYRFGFSVIDPVGLPPSKGP